MTEVRLLNERRVTDSMQELETDGSNNCLLGSDHLTAEIPITVLFFIKMKTALLCVSVCLFQRCACLSVCLCLLSLSVSAPVSVSFALVLCVCYARGCMHRAHTHTVCVSRNNTTVPLH